MSYLLSLKETAIRLRQKGFTVKEVSERLHIGKGTASLWLRNIKLSKLARKKLLKRKLLNYYKMSRRWQLKRQLQYKMYATEAEKFFRNLSLSKKYQQILCAFLFWAEGAKNLTVVKFINSDPKMIRAFLYLFRQSFSLDETKFRALIHLHEYHNEQRLKQYWSEVTNIPLKQFYKSYQKSHTKKRIRENYKGSINISYYDTRLARKLYAIYNTIADKIVGV